MPFRIDVSSTVQQLSAWVSDTSQRQIPFAASQAINASAVDAQTAVRTRMGRTFVLRRPDFANRSVKITQFATKAQLRAEIGIRGPNDAPARGDIFGKFEDGGTKGSRLGGSIAIPVAARASVSSIIPAPLRPRAVLDATATTRAFKARGADGTLVILQRTGALLGGQRGRAKAPHGAGRPRLRPDPGLRVLYFTRRSVHIPADLQFESTVHAVVLRVFGAHFADALAGALATAR